jgi:nicotinamide mononucleotide transporter
MLMLEICATVAGILYLYFAVRQRAICWAFYIVSALAYLPVLIASSLIVFAIFQVLFMVAGVLGLILWGNSPATKGEIKQLNVHEHLCWNALALATLSLSMALLPQPGGMLNALFDQWLSIYTLLTTILTARKVLENWLYWVAVNGVGIIASLNNHLYPTAIFFLINLIFALFGYREWAREMHKPKIT